MFSVPINPKLNEDQFYKFYDFCKDYKHLIYDLYFTCRIPPFVQDAMGDVIVANEAGAVEAALHIQETLGIRVSATFNNIMIRPDQRLLDMFIEKFTPIYNAGVRSATIPHTHWVSSGQIQKAFPELQIKNTILRNVTHAHQIAKLGEAGFHYVNIHRDVMRDRDMLIKMRKAADKYGIKLALLANEGCLGGCPMMDEHFQFNNTRTGQTAQYFNDPISRVSCPKWEYEDPSTPLKTANIPPWKEDWDELLQYVDVFKMHGREAISRLAETMQIVKNYDAGKEVLFDTFDSYLEETNLKEKPITLWRDKIKNCKFDCWDCNYCDKVYASKAQQESHPLILAVTKELVDSVNYDLNIDSFGLTSSKVQQLLYGISKHCKTYLEVGSGIGSTAKAVALNKDIIMHCVDNWKQNIQPESGEFELPLNTKQEFLNNVGRKDIIIYDSDLMQVDKSKIQKVDMFFYDGPHDFEETRDALKYYKDCLDDYAILIFDDANWAGVVEGVNAAVNETGMIPIYTKMMLNAVEDEKQWWNGLYIMVVIK
jgi:hypothetical protein